jgi:hypothetical protein
VDLAGFEALIAELRNAPEDIRADAMAIVRETTEAAAQEIREAYPKGPTGNLKSRVKTYYPSESVLAGIVRSTAPHSHLYEFGTRERKTKTGANRGRMPRPSPEVTPPIAIRHRASMFTQLVAMLRGKGFEIAD